VREIRFTNRAKEITLWISAALLALLLYRTAHLLSPFIWAIIATYIFHPLVTFMTRQTGVPRAVWIILIYIAMFSLVGWTIANVGPDIRDQTAALVREAPAALEQTERYIQEQPLLRRLGIQLEFSMLQREVETRSRELGERLALPVIRIVIDKAVRLFIFLVATFYMLLHAENVMGFFIGLAPRPYQHEIEGLVRRINHVLGAYLRSQLLLILIMSVATYIFLSIIKVESALVLGILTGFLEIIPLIGPYTAGAIAVSVALFQTTTPFGWSHLTLAIVVAIGYFVLRQLEDNLVIPMLIGRAVHLNPVIVMFVLLAGASIGGILGLLIAVPIASAVRIIVQYLYTKVLDREPPYVVSISGTDDPIEKLREAASAGAKRVVVVNVDENKALQHHRTYQQIARLISSEDLDVTFISSDAVARGLAQTHGMRLAANAI
jgi:predicted PurR-regulated permease PerM